MSHADTESHHENVWNIEQCLLVEGKSLYEHDEKIHSKYMPALKSHAETELYHENVWNIEQCLLVKVNLLWARRK